MEMPLTYIECRQVERENDTLENELNQNFNEINLFIDSFVDTIKLEEEEHKSSNLTFSNEATPSIKELNDNQASDISYQIKEIKKTRRINGLKDFKRAGTVDFYYKETVQFNGEIQEINKSSQTFKALLKNAADSEEMFYTDFDFDDLQFNSDKKLINIGANFIWLIGKKVRIISKDGFTCDGPMEKVSVLIFRRSRVLRNKEIEKAKDDAQNWTRFFNSINTTDSTDGR